METIAKLYEAIKAHSELDDDEIKDAGRHGADAGWNGFIYTGDCVEFYEANEGDIYDLLNEQANALGYPNVERMISEFSRSDMLETADGRKNLLAWFALEEVGQMLEDCPEACRRS